MDGLNGQRNIAKKIVLDFAILSQQNTLMNYDKIKAARRCWRCAKCGWRWFSKHIKRPYRCANRQCMVVLSSVKREK